MCLTKALVRRAIFASNIAIKRSSDIAIKRNFFSFCELKFSIMVISADFEKQKQYFDQKNIALSIYCNIGLPFYRNIACETRSFDEGLRGS
jgi:hypothetical protein